MYKELFKKYEGVYIGNHSAAIQNYNIIRAINMSNALGYSCRGNMNFKGVEGFINYPLNYSNYGVYKFKPIFYDKELYSLLYTKEELINEGYSLEEANLMEGYYKYMKMCHSVTLLYLIENGKDCLDIRAITSLARTVDDKYYFHSYICYFSNELGMNMIADFSQNIIMPKFQYDELVVEKELNVLNYLEYIQYINNSNYDSKCGLNELLYLGLVSLEKYEKKQRVN